MDYLRWNYYRRTILPRPVTSPIKMTTYRDLHMSLSIVSESLVNSYPLQIAFFFRCKLE